MPSSMGPVVLIVAAHQETLAMYAIGLMSMGFQPVVAATAQLAFDRACKLSPDVIIADASLSAAARSDLVHRLRVEPRTQHGLIIAIGDTGTPTHLENDCDRCICAFCPPYVLGVQIQQMLASRAMAHDR